MLLNTLKMKQINKFVTMTADIGSGYCHRSSEYNIIYCLSDSIKRPHYTEMKVY